MVKRTTIEIDQELLERAKRALGCSTTRATVEEALRVASEAADAARASRAESQLRYLAQLHTKSDLDVMRSEEMWK